MQYLNYITQYLISKVKLQLQPYPMAALTINIVTTQLMIITTEP